MQLVKLKEMFLNSGCERFRVVELRILAEKQPQRIRIHIIPQYISLWKHARNFVLFVFHHSIAGSWDTDILSFIGIAILLSEVIEQI